jgi:hypothetical protein
MLKMSWGRNGESDYTCVFCILEYEDRRDSKLSLKWENDHNGHICIRQMNQHTG